MTSRDERRFGPFGSFLSLMEVNDILDELALHGDTIQVLQKTGHDEGHVAEAARVLRKVLNRAVARGLVYNAPSGGPLP